MNSWRNGYTNMGIPQHLHELFRQEEEIARINRATNALNASAATLETARMLSEQRSLYSRDLALEAASTWSMQAKIGASLEIALTDPFCDVYASLLPSQKIMDATAGFSTPAEIAARPQFQSDFSTAMEQATEASRIAAGLHTSALLDNLVAKAKEVLNPVSSLYRETIATAQTHASVFSNHQSSLARSWLGDQDKHLSLLQRSAKDLAEISGNYTETMMKLGQSPRDLAGAMDTMKMVFEGASVASQFNGGLIRQSFAAAALVEASRYDRAAVEMLRGRSFLLDAFAEVDRYIGAATEDADLAEAEESGVAADVTDLIERILALLHRYLANAKSAYEQASLFDVLNLVVAVTFGAAAYQATLDASASGDKTAAELKEEITRQGEAQTKLLAGILVELQATRKASEQVTYYVVRHTRPLKSEKSMKSATVATLHPNQVVKLLEREGKWIEIEYFDYLAGGTRTGWVVKKYLKMGER